MKKPNWKQLCGLLLMIAAMFALNRLFPLLLPSPAGTVLRKLLLGLLLALGLNSMGVLKSRLSPLATLIPSAVILLLYAGRLIASINDSLVRFTLTSFAPQPVGALLTGIFATLGIQGFLQKQEWKKWNALWAIPLTLLALGGCLLLYFVGTLRGKVDNTLYQLLWNANWLFPLAVLPFINRQRVGGVALLLVFGLWWLLAAFVPVLGTVYRYTYDQLFLTLLLIGAGNVLLSFEKSPIQQPTYKE